MLKNIEYWTLLQNQFSHKIMKYQNIRISRLPKIQAKSLKRPKEKKLTPRLPLSALDKKKEKHNNKLRDNGVEF